MKLFKNTKASRGIRLTAIALAMVVLVSGTVMLQGHSSAAAEDNKVIVTSPFTAAVAEVKDSVVGVRNYQVVRYSNNGYGSFGDWGNFFGFGNWGNGYGYGDGYGNNYGDQNRSEEVLAGTGSGVVIADHYVLTNFHVVEKATSLKVTVAKDDVDEPDLYSAVVVASDENLDIAVIYAPDLDLKPVQLGDSDTLQVGDWAICIGNPLAERFYGTVTAGIVSALNRSVNNTSYDKYGHKDVTTNTMIQVDAAINNGNSGGGMFSVTGELMGIPTLKYSGTAYAGADSRALLRQVVAMLQNEGFCVGNIDATLVAQKPKMAPYLPQMRQHIADDCGVALSCVNVKATTEEGLGFTGAMQGIAAHCVCLIRRA